MKKITYLLLIVANSIFAQNFTDHVVDNAADGISTSFVVDVDNDTDLDIISVSYFDDELAWYENDGNQNYTKHSIDNNVDGAIYVNAGDGNGDGFVDILVNAFDGNQVIVYFNDGNQNFVKLIVDSASMGSNHSSVQDIDGDNNLDIFVAAFNGDQIVRYSYDGIISFTKTVIDSSVNGASSVIVEDINGDGELDLLVSKFGDSGAAIDGEVSWYENDGSENFTKHIIDNTLVSPTLAYIVDLDQNGTEDVLVSDSEGDEIAWYSNNGSEVFTKHTIDASFDYASFATPVDLNNDGFLDIIASETGPSKLYWFENDGTQSFTKHLVNINLGDTFGLFPADIDQDGDQDVTVASYNVDTLRWLENDFISIPENDLAINAIAINCGDIITGDTTDASIDPQGDCGDANDDSNNVWYTYTGTVAEDIVLSTCSINTNFDTMIAVYTGTPGALVCLVDNDDDVTCDDDLLSTVSFSSDGNTTYFIKVQGYDEDESGMFEMNIGCTLSSVEELTQFNFNYSPNPVNNVLTISANENITDISIYNLLGQEVKKSTPGISVVDLDLSNLSNGTYFVKAQIDNTIGTFKIIKK